MVTDKRVAQTKTLPTPVPFVALNYRLTNDLPTSTWKSNLYVTGLAGINPNTSTTDFGAGVSLSVRSLMVSVVAHFGHDTELTQGLKVDQNLGAGFRDSLTTRTFWTTTIAVGVSSGCRRSRAADYVAPTAYVGGTRTRLIRRSS